MPINSKNIIENCGGEMTVHSVCGEGTTFVLNFPVARKGVAGEESKKNSDSR